MAFKYRASGIYLYYKSIKYKQYTYNTFSIYTWWLIFICIFNKIKHVPYSNGKGGQIS